MRRAIADAEEAAKALRVELDHAKAVVAFARVRMGLPEKSNEPEAQKAANGDSEPKPASRETA